MDPTSSEMDIPEVRRRVRAAIEQARRDAGERRERTDAASRAYEQFLAARAVPAFNLLAAALVAEGHRFKVFTPADRYGWPPRGRPRTSSSSRSIRRRIRRSVLGRTNVGRGRRALTRERPSAQERWRRRSSPKRT